ncbi:restriction endonuclease subunit S, partial [Escherichia coli]|nr:restriction endonuclease subunit S [Escherichia coli]
DKLFLHYLLSTQLVRDQIEATASGTKQRNTSPDKIYDVTVWVPNIDQQRIIGRYLYSLEQKCNVNNKICSELETMAKTLYDYWFVQFDFPD